MSTKKRSLPKRPRIWRWEVGARPGWKLLALLNRFSSSAGEMQLCLDILTLCGHGPQLGLSLNRHEFWFVFHLT